MSKFPQKITQLQCYQTNQELKGMFTSGLGLSFKYFPNFLSYIYNQIELIAGFLEYRFTIAKGQSQPGDKLQNLIFRHDKLSKNKKLLWLLFSVILPYIWKKINQNIQRYFSESTCQNIYQIIHVIQKIYKLLQFVNLAIFIKKGHYRCLVQRILNIKMQFISKQSARVLNFSLMNRRMIWQIYELFLQNIFPFLHKTFSSALKNVYYLHSYMEVETENNCIICHSKQIVMPILLQPCNHRGCYYCISSMKQQISSCPNCSTQISSLKHQYI